MDIDESFIDITNPTTDVSPLSSSEHACTATMRRPKKGKPPEEEAAYKQARRAAQRDYDRRSFFFFLSWPVGIFFCYHSRQIINKTWLFTNAEPVVFFSKLRVQHAVATLQQKRSTALLLIHVSATK